MPRFIDHGSAPQPGVRRSPLGISHQLHLLGPQPAVKVGQADLGLGRLATEHSLGDSDALPNREQTYHRRLMNRGIQRVSSLEKLGNFHFCSLKCPLALCPTPRPQASPTSELFWYRPVFGFAFLGHLLITGSNYGHWPLAYFSARTPTP